MVPFPLGLDELCHETLELCLNGHWRDFNRPQPQDTFKKSELICATIVFGCGTQVLRFAEARALAVEQQKTPPWAMAGRVKGRPRAEGPAGVRDTPGVGGRLITPPARATWLRQKTNCRSDVFFV